MMRSQRPLELLITSLLFDPELAQELHERPEELSASFNVSSEQLSWLLAIDPRRWRADPERPHRALEGLLLHLPVSVAISTLRGGSAEEYLGFFQSPQLRRSLEERTLLAEGFCSWLRAQTTSWSPMRAALSALELAIAQLNSEERGLEISEDLSASRALTLSPRVRLIRAPQGALVLYSELSEALRTLEPLAALSQPQLLGFSEALERHASAQERVVDEAPDALTIIAQLSHGEVALSEAPRALAELLWATHEQLTYPSALALLDSYGLEPSEASELLLELQGEDLISLS